MRILAIAALLLASLPAGAEQLTGFTPQLIGEVLSGEGATYEIGTDPVGDPMIEVVTGSVFPSNQLQILFYDCEAGRCEDIQIWSWYTAVQPIDLALINAFNRDSRWVRAYIDTDSDPVLEMDINATGGIGREALEILIRTYFEAMRRFDATIDGQIAPRGTPVAPSQQSEGWDVPISLPVRP